VISENSKKNRKTQKLLNKMIKPLHSKIGKIFLLLMLLFFTILVDILVLITLKIIENFKNLFSSELLIACQTFSSF
jgi:hypothetical protein